MVPYSKEELSGSVFYPACGVDFKPILAFSHLSDFFIFVDWSDIHSNGLPEGITSSLNRYCKKISSQIAPDKLELSQDILTVDIPEFRYDTSPNMPGGFEFELRELDRLKYVGGRHRSFWQPWARQFTIHKTVQGKRTDLTVLYVSSEAFAVYCALYNSGRIAPKVLVTIQSGGGLGGGFVKLEDPKGIMSRFLDACNIKPVLWVRGGMRGSSSDPLPYNPEDGLYNQLVRGYYGWNEQAAVYARADTELPDDFLENEWTMRDDFSDLMGISAYANK